MANFCEKCGSPLNGEKFCSNCGAPVVEAPAPATQAPFNPAAPAAPLSAEDAKDASDNKAMGILAYFGILVFIPIFAAKNSKFARFHSNQGLTLFIISVGMFLFNMGIEWATRSTTSVWGIAVPTHNWVYSLWSVIYWIGLIFIFVLAIMGIVNATKGECKELPIIGKINSLKHI